MEKTSLNNWLRTGVMAAGLRALLAVPEGPGLVPTTHLTANNHF